MPEQKQKRRSSPPRPVKRVVTPHAKPAVVHRTPVKHASLAIEEKQAPRDYFMGVGRRKEAVVQVRLTPASSKPEITVNGKPVQQYFPYPDHFNTATSALEQTGMLAKFSVRARAEGGGLHGQAVAMRMGLARALVRMDAGLRGQLRALGYLTRDSRAKERKKPGLKRARRAPQFSKR